MGFIAVMQGACIRKFVNYLFTRITLDTRTITYGRQELIIYGKGLGDYRDAPCGTW